jgi:hypothetical protein
MCIPSLRNRFFLPFRIQFPFPWLGTLYKCTLLRVELAKHTTRLSVINHTSTLPPPTRITWTVLSTANIGSRLCRRCTAHASRKLGPTIQGVVGRFD